MCDWTPGWSGEETKLTYIIGLVHRTIYPNIFFLQSSPQRDFVVLAVQTPQRESEGQLKSSRGSGPLDDIDVEWVTEHARQVGSLMSCHSHTMALKCFYSLVVQVMILTFSILGVPHVTRRSLYSWLVFSDPT